jgi:hypothetical protein
MNLKVIDGEYVDIATGRVVHGSESKLNKRLLFLPDTYIPFGKYKNWKLSTIWKYDPHYVYWMRDAGFNICFDLDSKEPVDDIDLDNCRIFEITEEEGITKSKRVFRKIKKSYV